MQKIRGLFVDPDGVPSVRLDGPSGGPGSDRIVQVHYVRHGTVFNPNLLHISLSVVLQKFLPVFPKSSKRSSSRNGRYTSPTEISCKSFISHSKDSVVPK